MLKIVRTAVVSALVGATIVAVPAERADAATVTASFLSEATSAVAPGVHASFTTATITATGTSTLTFTMNQSGHSETVQLVPPPGVELLTAATYTAVQPVGSQTSGHLGVALSVDGHACSSPSGDVQLDDVEVDDGPVLVSFAGRFAIHCGGGVVFGAISYASATVEPTITVTQPSYDFGNARQWYGGTQTVVTIANTSSTTLQLGSLSVDSDQVAVRDESCSNAELFAGWSCLFEIVTTPTRYGPVHASVTIPSDATTIGSTAGLRIAVDYDVVSPAPGVRFDEHPFLAANIPPGDVLVGDFDENGQDDLFDYRPGTASDGLWLAVSEPSTQNGFTRRAMTINGVYETQLGDFDGDGHLDVLFYAPGATPDAIWYGRGDATFTKVTYTINGTFEPVVTDLDSNATTDILWYGPGRAPDAEWRFSTDRTKQSVPITINGVYDGVGGGDFNGDFRSDLMFWSHTATRHPVWMSTGASGHTVTSLPSPSVGALPVVMNADGDDLSDILWYNPGPAADALALGDAANVQLLPLRLNSSYVPLVANFDGDNAELDDVLWWSTNSAPDRFWADGLTNVSLVQQRWSPQTHDAVIGYFDDDETADVLFVGNHDGPVWFGNDVDGAAPPFLTKRSPRRTPNPSVRRWG